MGFRNPFRIQVDAAGVAYVADYSPDSQARPACGPARARAASRSSASRPTTAGRCVTRPTFRCTSGTSMPRSRWVRPTSATTRNTVRRTSRGWNTGLCGPAADHRPGRRYSFRDDLWARRASRATTSRCRFADTCSADLPGAASPVSTASVRTCCASTTTSPTTRARRSSRRTTTTPSSSAEWTRDYLREIRIDSNKKVLKISDAVNCGGVGSHALTPVRVRQPDGRAVRRGRQPLPADLRRRILHPEPAGRRVPVVVRQGSAGAERGDRHRPDGRSAAAHRRVQSRVRATRIRATACSFEWDFNGDGTVDSTDPSPSYTYTQAGVYTARLVVKDPQGNQDIKTVTITVGNTTPIVTITTPVNGDFFEWGEAIPYTVAVADPRGRADRLQPRRRQVHPGAR